MTNRKEYFKEYHKQWYKRQDKAILRERSRVGHRNTKSRNKKLLYKYLLSHPCSDCGNTNPVVLEFDHLKDKKTDICKLVNGAYSWKVIMHEISKCEVVCANCHRIRTASRGKHYRALMAQSAQQEFCKLPIESSNLSQGSI